MECVLRFSNVLKGTPFALNDINHILGATIGTSVHLEDLSGRRAADGCTHFYMGACLAAWLLTPAIPRVGFFYWP